MKTATIPAHGNTKYQFASMEVGDSFPIEPWKVATVTAAAYQFKKNSPNGKKKSFSVRTSEGEIRIYRTK